jgi:hypothetical protein
VPAGISRARTHGRAKGGAQVEAKHGEKKTKATLAINKQSRRGARATGEAAWRIEPNLNLEENVRRERTLALKQQVTARADKIHDRVGSDRSAQMLLNRAPIARALRRPQHECFGLSQ